MAAETELVKAVPALQQQLDTPKTPEAEAAAKAAANQKVTDCAAAQQLSREEYEDWIDDQAMKAYNVLLGVEQFTDQKNKDLEAQVEANNAKFAAAKANLAAYTAAQKDGRRVMTDCRQKAATTQAAAADKEKSVGLLHEDTDADSGQRRRPEASAGMDDGGHGLQESALGVGRRRRGVVTNSESRHRERLFPLSRMHAARSPTLRAISIWTTPTSRPMTPTWLIPIFPPRRRRRPRSTSSTQTPLPRPKRTSRTPPSSLPAWTRPKPRSRPMPMRWPRTFHRRISS